METIFAAIAPYTEQIHQRYPQLRDNLKTAQIGVPLACATLLIVYLFAPVLIHLLAVCYPVLMTVKAIESSHKDESPRWLTYWIIFHFIALIEFIGKFFLSFIPGYYIIKLVVLGWCMAPIQDNGCAMFIRMGGNRLLMSVLKHLEPVFGVAQKKMQTVIELKNLAKPILTDSIAEALANKVTPALSDADSDKKDH